MGTKKKFTPEELKHLQANPYTLRVTADSISYTLAFKEAFWALSLQGYIGTAAFRKLGYNCIGAFDVPDRRKIPEADIIMETRKVLAPGTHSHFESGKFSQFWPEPGTNPAQWVRLKTPFRVHPKQPN